MCHCKEEINELSFPNSFSQVWFLMAFLLTATASAYVNTNLLAGSLVRLNPRSQEQGCRSGQLHTLTGIVMGTQVSPALETHSSQDSPHCSSVRTDCAFFPCKSPATEGWMECKHFTAVPCKEQQRHISTNRHVVQGRGLHHFLRSSSCSP